jgi:hypothetical protein
MLLKSRDGKSCSFAFLCVLCASALNWPDHAIGVIAAVTSPL